MPDQTPETIKYTCLSPRCGHTWDSPALSLDPCPKCGNHHYRWRGAGCSGMLHRPGFKMTATTVGKRGRQ